LRHEPYPELGRLAALRGYSGIAAAFPQASGCDVGDIIPPTVPVFAGPSPSPASLQAVSDPGAYRGRVPVTRRGREARVSRRFLRILSSATTWTAPVGRSFTTRKPASFWLHADFDRPV